MRSQIDECAQLGILSAMLLLGDNLRKVEPPDGLALVFGSRGQETIQPALSNTG